MERGLETGRSCSTSGRGARRRKIRAPARGASHERRVLGRSRWFLRQRTRLSSVKAHTRPGAFKARAGMPRPGRQAGAARSRHPLAAAAKAAQLQKCSGACEARPRARLGATNVMGWGARASIPLRATASEARRVRVAGPRLPAPLPSPVVGKRRSRPYCGERP